MVVRFFPRRTRAAQELELELGLIQPHMAQKPVLRGEVGCACIAREVSVEREGMGERGCARRLGANSKLGTEQNSSQLIFYHHETWAAAVTSAPQTPPHRGGSTWSRRRDSHGPGGQRQRPGPRRYRRLLARAGACCGSFLAHCTLRHRSPPLLGFRALAARPAQDSY